MARFPDIPPDAVQFSLFQVPVPPTPFRYPLRRTVKRQSGLHLFCDLSEQRYQRGIPTVEFGLRYPRIPTAQKRNIMHFYRTAGGQSANNFSMIVDNVGYSGCRFLAPIEYENIGPGLWSCDVRIRSLDGVPVATTTSSTGGLQFGAGAQIIVPQTALSYTIQWNAYFNSNFFGPNIDGGSVQIVFDGLGGATLQYVAGSGGTGDGLGKYVNDWGYNGTYYVNGVGLSPDGNGTLPAGPVSIGTTFVPGQEVVLQMMTSGFEGIGTSAGTVFYSGPAWRNPDGCTHANVITP